MLVLIISLAVILVIALVLVFFGSEITGAIALLFKSEFAESVHRLWSTYGNVLLRGAGYTLLISLIATLIGLVIGIIVGVLKTIPPSKRGFLRGMQKVLNFILSAYVEVFRGTPMMVQAMVIFWGYAFMNGGKTLPTLPSALFIVSINTGAYISEIVRGGITSIDKGQFEGAHAIGMTHWQTMAYVIIPQVIKNIIPAVGNEFVINVKDTSVLNVIGVVELYYQATVIRKATYLTFETFAIICLMYFIMTFSITLILRVVEKLLTGKANFTLKHYDVKGAKK